MDISGEGIMQAEVYYYWTGITFEAMITAERFAYNNSKFTITESKAVAHEQMAQLDAEADTKRENKEEDVEGFFKKRYIQGYMMFFMFFMAFSFRVNLSVAIVAMTVRNSAHSDLERLDWDLNTRSKILSSFFWGYLVIQLPAGQLGQMFSVKKLLLFANLSCAVLTLLTPVAAVHGGWFLVCIIRVLQGLSQGFYVPLSYTLSSKWVPLDERNRFVGFFLNGGTIGAMVSLAMSGLLASSSGGWQSVFYVPGVLGLLWTALWWWLGADSPLTHPTIHPRERDHILTALQSSNQTEVLPTPWKAIFKSVPVWALIGVAVCNGWGFSVILTQLPTYIEGVLGVEIEKNGFLSALPYLSLWCFSFPACWLADYIGKQKILSTEMIRKLFTTLCLGGSSMMILCLCFVERDVVAATTFITLAVTFTAFMFSGFNINYLDLSPNFAGVLMGLCNGMENVGTIIAPLYVGWVVSDLKSFHQWRWVFAAIVAVSLLGNAIYVIFGSADVQPWNSPAKAPKNTKNHRSNEQTNEAFTET